MRKIQTYRGGGDDLLHCLESDCFFGDVDACLCPTQMNCGDGGGVS